MDATIVTDREAFRRVAAGAPASARVPVEVRVAVPDPFLAYRSARDGRWSVFLETTGGQSGWGYFGVDPVETLTVGSDGVEGSGVEGSGVEGSEAEDGVGEGERLDDDGPSGDLTDGGSTGSGGGLDRGVAGSPSLAALEAAVADEELVRGDCDVPYPCGALGWIAYDVAREIEALPDETTDERGLPRVQFGVYDRLAAWEEPRDGGETTLRITACPRIGDGDGDGGVGRVDGRIDDDDGHWIDDAYDRGLARAMDLADRIHEGDPGVGPAPAAVGTAVFESQSGRAAYEDRVRAVREYVRDGDTFQANVSHRLVAPAAVHPVEAYAAVRAVNPAPYSALVEFPGVDLVSASPELLLDVEGDRLHTEPIAGTRPRGETAAADDALEAELLGDEKERAEHAMLVDLERNDLGKVSRYGSVAVEEYRRVDRYSEVMHLVSSVVGQRREDVSLAEAIAAVFPGGTITGAPKPRTMEIIEELETTRRGPYTGSVGIVGFDDRATLSITIRTLVRTGEEYGLRVGAGIVHDSVPAREYDETLAKARALLTAVDEALAGDADLAVAGPAGGENGTAGGADGRSKDGADAREATGDAFGGEDP